MALVFTLLNLLVLLYMLVLFGRLILDYIPLFDREWRPKGAMLVVAEVVYTITDPPIRFLRRFIPPLRVGGVAIDFAFAITMFVCIILLSVTSFFAAM
ncbi:YggT family protein [Microbacterium sediminis]